MALFDVDTDRVRFVKPSETVHNAADDRSDVDGIGQSSDVVGALASTGDSSTGGGLSQARETEKGRAKENRRQTGEGDAAVAANGSSAVNRNGTEHEVAVQCVDSSGNSGGGDGSVPQAAPTSQGGESAVDVASKPASNEGAYDEDIGNGKKVVGAGLEQRDDVEADQKNMETEEGAREGGDYEETEWSSLAAVRIIRGPSMPELNKRKQALEKWSYLGTGGLVSNTVATAAAPGNPSVSDANKAAPSGQGGTEETGATAPMTPTSTNKQQNLSSTGKKKGNTKGNGLPAGGPSRTMSGKKKKLQGTVGIARFVGALTAATKAASAVAADQSTLVPAERAAVAPSSQV